MRVFTRLPMHDWRHTAAAAREAEAAGYDAVMTVELGHDVFAALAIAAMATERVELTPSVAVAFPRSPTVLASQAWDLQANSHGRFVLGLGSQVKGHNERRFGCATMCGHCARCGSVGRRAGSWTSTANITR
jgi:alkanesulfonate monooxygenase SsuD/methylene tetrahydromethanopterin reductase-like flavin-dependent oxidoreductase (luciferase family)